jgi:hypothetical protein
MLAEVVMKQAIVLLVAAMALIAALAWMTPGLTQETSSIHGSVVDSKNHRPLQSIEVAAYAVHQRRAVGSALTGKDGTFAIRGLAGGDYKLVISATGYEVENVTGVSLRPAERLIIAGAIPLRRASLTSQTGIARPKCSSLVNPNETASVYVVCGGR